MGLLDNLPPGLLDILRNSAAGQQFPGMLQQDQASYGQQMMPVNSPSPLDTARWPQGPVGAPGNAQASMSQGPQAPMGIPQPNPPPVIQAQQPQQPEGDGRLMLGLKGFLGNMAGGPVGALAGGLGAAITGQPTDAGSIQAQQQNMTARALIAKGADPTIVQAAARNPTLMAELIKQNFGPQTVTPLGNGYVWDQRAGKAVKAYEPDAKPPTSLGEGYIWNPESGKVERAYTPIDKKQTLQQEISAREQGLISRGMDPKDARNQQFILTGKWPREDAQPLTATDKTAILEADDAVMTTKNVISALQEAKKISPKAHTGYGAGLRATLGNNLPDMMVPDVVASKESAAATSNYENLVLGQALGQLKSIFGAAPTEGERKILLELQASVDKPDNVRQEILQRATNIAQARLNFNQQRADQLRGGTYYKSGQSGAPSAGKTYTWNPDGTLTQ